MEQVTQHPEWKTYALEMDTFDGSIRRFSDTRIIDGDPIRCGNISGFINSTVVTQPKCRANCKWVFFKDLLQHHTARLIMRTMS